MEIIRTKLNGVTKNKAKIKEIRNIYRRYMLDHKSHSTTKPQ
jgi:inosine/xanthosine triphosphate pyrophosphatase family protein